MLWTKMWSTDRPTSAKQYTPTSSKGGIIIEQQSAEQSQTMYVQADLDTNSQQNKSMLVNKR